MPRLPSAVFLILVLLFEDLRVSFSWWFAARKTPRDEEALRLLRKGGLRGRVVLLGRDLSGLLRWMHSGNILLRFVGFMMTFIACMILGGMRERETPARTTRQ